MRNSMYFSMLLSVIFLVFDLSDRNASYAQGVEEVERLSAEVRAHMDLYYRLFSDQNMEALPDEVFTIPWMTFGANGVDIRRTRDEALVNWQGSLIGLLQRGWDHSEYTVEHVCIVNANTAIVSGYNTRYAEDGSEMSIGSVVYFLARDASDWRIVAYTGVEGGKRVDC